LPLHEMQEDMNTSLFALLNPLAQHPPEFHFNREVHVQCRRSKSFIEDIVSNCRPKVDSVTSLPETATQEELQPLRDKPEVKPAKEEMQTVHDASGVKPATQEMLFPQYSEAKPAIQEPVDVNQVLLPQEVSAVHATAPPQFSTQTPPTRTQPPIVGTTCWSAGAAVATGAATSFMSMTSRTAPQTNGQQAAELPTHTVIYGARTAAPLDFQGSRVAPAVKSADAVHSKAPPNIHFEADVGITEGTASPARIGVLQEAPFASHLWEKQCGPPSQPRAASGFSTSASQVRHFDADRFPGTGGGVHHEADDGSNRWRIVVDKGDSCD